jgi:hypothetical protein
MSDEYDILLYMQNKWKKKDILFLVKNYPKNGRKWCMNKLNRTEGSIREKTSELNLKLDKNSDFFKEFQERARKSKIGKKRPDQSILMKKLHAMGKLKQNKIQCENISKRMKLQWKTILHPRGMLGKYHSKKTKIIISINSKKMWKNPKSTQNSIKYRQVLSDRAKEQHKNGFLNEGYSRAKMGHYDINGRDIFFRSSWEANYALYLDFLVKRKEIIGWEFEVDTFWFEKIKRGVRSYKPDFKIFKNNGEIEYHEVKGYMDKKSITKIKRMAKYYPKIKLIVVDEKSYKDIKNKIGKMLGFY